MLNRKIIVIWAKRLGALALKSPESSKAHQNSNNTQTCVILMHCVVGVGEYRNNVHYCTTNSTIPRPNLLCGALYTLPVYQDTPVLSVEFLCSFTSLQQHIYKIMLQLNNYSYLLT